MSLALVLQHAVLAWLTFSTPEPAPTNLPEGVLSPPHTIEFVDTLDPFFARLAALEDGKTQDVVRVVNFGASTIGQDDLPSILREKFQTRFGDGGAGMVLMQRFMNNYRHRWVELKGRGWDNCYIAYLCKRDGHYGIGGAVFWSNGGATTTISTRKHELGDEAAHYEVWYAAQPHGGKLEVQVDDGEKTLLDTRAPKLEDRFHSFDVEPGAHTIHVRSRGRTRTYGVVVETAGPGIIWDQFSWLGSFTRRMLAWDEQHIKGQIKQRNPDLVVFFFGGNDSRRVLNGKLTKAGYQREYSESVRRVRAGKPGVPCLILATFDRSKSLNYDIKAEHLKIIVDAQRDTARDVGCAFYDTYAAMGGDGALKRWRKKGLAAPDQKHLNHRGRLVVGGWLYDSLMAAYGKYRERD